MASSTQPNARMSGNPLPSSRRSNRIRNQAVALSLNEVKETARGLCKSPNNPSHHRAEAGPDIPASVDDPSKQINRAKAKSEHTQISEKLPERYEKLCEFFNGLDNSIRLLRMRGSMPSFTTICRMIEGSTGRRFSLSHFAQIKFILPEAIEAKKVLLLDEETKCMKPELRIVFNEDAMDRDKIPKLGSGNLHMRKTFRSRLLDFWKAHPEAVEIPEDTLPQPFNRSKLDSQTRTIQELPATFTNERLPEQQLGVSSLLPQTFSRKLSSKVSNNEVQKLHQKLTKDSLYSENLTPFECHGKTPQNDGSIYSVGPSLTEEVSTPATPVKLISTPAKLLSGTPSIQSLKNSSKSPDECSTHASNKLTRRPTRSLKFDTPVKKGYLNDEEKRARSFTAEDDILDVNLLSSIQEKEQKTLEERDPAISQAKRRRKMIAALPKLFAIIHCFFQSIKRSVVTREELVHNIIKSCHDMVDRGEVHEQLRLLQELVPEWIHEKVAMSGDCLMCINKGCSPGMVQDRLAEAK